MPYIFIYKRYVIIIFFSVTIYYQCYNYIQKSNFSGFNSANQSFIYLRSLKKELKTQLANNFGLININKNKYNFKFIHNSEQVCIKKPPFLMILIKSKVNHIEERDIIRNTWAKLDKYGLIKRVFLVGIPNPNFINNADYIKKMVNEESVKNKDIVQKDFYDSYFNNTLQTLMGLEWAVYFCPKVFFLFNFNF